VRSINPKSSSQWVLRDEMASTGWSTSPVQTCSFQALPSLWRCHIRSYGSVCSRQLPLLSITVYCLAFHLSLSQPCNHCRKNCFDNRLSASLLSLFGVARYGMLPRTPSLQLNRPNITLNAALTTASHFLGSRCLVSPVVYATSHSSPAIAVLRHVK
jgi:hypothetical protein